MKGGRRLRVGVAVEARRPGPSVGWGRHVGVLVFGGVVAVADGKRGLGGHTWVAIWVEAEGRGVAGTFDRKDLGVSEFGTVVGRCAW